MDAVSYPRSTAAPSAFFRRKSSCRHSCWGSASRISITDEFSRAENTFQHLLAEYPKSDSSAEAAYYLGVSRYKRTHNAEELKKTIQHLQRDFPQSEWVKRASVYQLL